MTGTIADPTKDEGPTASTVEPSIDSTPGKGIETMKKASTEVLESEVTV